VSLARMLRTPAPTAYHADRALTASASIIRTQDQAALRERRSVTAAWQETAWQHYDAIGEVKFAFGIVAQALSRLRLYPGAVLDPQEPPVPVSDGIKPPEGTAAAEATDDSSGIRRQRGISPQLAAAASDIMARNLSRGVSGLLRSFALNLSVAGECYLVRHDGKWHVYSTDELRFAGSQVTLQTRGPNGGARLPKALPPNTLIGRVWRNHPRYSEDPDSSMLGVEEPCGELLSYGRMLRANSRSRMNAGLLFLPDSITVAAKANPDGTLEGEEEGDPLEADLIYNLTDPVKSDSSAASVIPLLLRGPDEAGALIKHITLATDVSEVLAGRADRALDRILQGLDVPKEMVAGLQNVKYSNAIVITNALYTTHIEPMALTIADALTEVILQPQLRALGFGEEEVSQVCVWFDANALVDRPEHSADADKGYELGLISGKAWRDAKAFGDTDAPDETEMARKLAIGGTIPPEVITVLLQVLLPGLLKEARAANTAGQELPAELESMLGGEDVAAVDVGQSSVPEGGAA